MINGRKFKDYFASTSSKMFIHAVKSNCSSDQRKEAADEPASREKPIHPDEPGFCVHSASLPVVSQPRKGSTNCAASGPGAG